MTYVGLIHYKDVVLHIEDISTKSPRKFDSEEDAKKVTEIFGLPFTIMDYEEYIKKMKNMG